MILHNIDFLRKYSLLGLSLVLFNNTSCIDYMDNVNPNEVTEE